MAFFKFRKGADEHPTPAAPPESVEAMRTRARHRLIGASVLVVAGVIGFPLLFDGQPRPIAVDIPIEIPDRNTVKPLSSVPLVKPDSSMVVESDGGKPVDSTVRAPTAELALAGNASRSAAGTLSEPSHAQVPLLPKPVPKPETRVESKSAPKPIEKSVEKMAEKSVDKSVQIAPVQKPLNPLDDGAKARALLEGKDAPALVTQLPVASASATAAAPSPGRFVVQIGAFSDAAKAQEPRGKLERAGLKTYTQAVQTKDGKRIRVRVGPFDSKAEADRAAEKIRQLDLPAAILEL